MGNWINRDRKINSRKKISNLNHKYEDIERIQKKRKKKNLRIIEKLEDE